ncbi:MAG: WecB/TagA/CpsF family glycosyltransferase [Lachnospiraceae bacterium]|nr:WecB/TagA/CpsF family glycosyltransferase [Lachnospiraceae bacterium]
MVFENKQSQRSFLLILDVASTVISFLLAVVIRFYDSGDWDNIRTWNNGLYFMLLELVIAIEVAVFFVNETRHRSISVQNPFEKLVNVIKNQILVMGCLLVLLYMIRQGLWASRAVVGMMFIFNVLIDFILRFCYGRFLCGVIAANTYVSHYVLISKASDAKRIITQIGLHSGKETEISGVIVLDDDAQELPGINVLGRLSEAEGILKRVKADEIIVNLHDNRCTAELIRKLELSKMPVNWISEFMGRDSDQMMIKRIGGRSFYHWSGMFKCAPVLGINYSVTNIAEAVLFIRTHLDELRGKYICLSNVHTTVMANENKEYLEIQNGAALTLPDGAPIAKVQRENGFPQAKRVAGPDLMQKCFESALDGGLSMYFYGSSENTIEKLKKNLINKYPGIDIRGFESPPFRELTKEEDEAAVKRINDSGADIVWIGLGAPKQEKWMAEHQGKIKGVMIGVGAGFDFHAGTIKRAPEWVQHIGMEWFFRLFQDPRRLIRRYFITNVKFMWYLLIHRFKKN